MSSKEGMASKELSHGRVSYIGTWHRKSSLNEGCVIYGHGIERGLSRKGELSLGMASKEFS